MSKYDPITRVIRLFALLHLVVARQCGKRLGRAYQDVAGPPVSASWGRRGKTRVRIAVAPSILGIA